MAAALARRVAGDRIVVHSAGSEPGERVHPAVVEVLMEIGLDLSATSPAPLTEEMARHADVVVTKGCGDACPYYPGTRYVDWDVLDPAGMSVDDTRAVRDEPERRVRALVGELLERAP